MPGEPFTVQSFAESDGALLVGTRNGVRRFAEGKFLEYTAQVRPRRSRLQRLLRDREGALWIGAMKGLVHIHHGKTDVFCAI
jgi:ligand-binding sensor domain-containing protein